MVDMFVKTVKKAHTHAMLFKLHCTLEYFLEVPLAGIKSHEPLHLDRGISVKWQVMVA
jgi:hypothetical protein